MRHLRPHWGHQLRSLLPCVLLAIASAVHHLGMPASHIPPVLHPYLAPVIISIDQAPVDVPVTVQSHAATAVRTATSAFLTSTINRKNRILSVTSCALS